MFGMERKHFVPFLGFARHTRKTVHFMEVFQDRVLLRHLPGGLILSLYNALILVLAAFAVSVAV